ncbi:MAG: hypothetical protein M3Z01_03220 [Thermoproteota archaeon]|nr:hypothetical protein [Thermoproteota archaeon]
MMNFILSTTTFGWGPFTIMLIFTLSVIGTSIAFFIIISTTSLSVQRFREKKKYRLEAIWSVFVASILIWLYFTSLPWTPPSTFSEINNNNKTLQVVNITAGQWFWLFEKVDTNSSNNTVQNSGNAMNHSSKSPITVKQNVPVKFVATSIDVNHGFGIFSGAQDGSPILLQMQVIPGMQNIFYYTFKESGDFLIRCLEYCGYAHPYMTSRIHVVPENDMPKISSSIGAATK